MRTFATMLSLSLVTLVATAINNNPAFDIYNYKSLGLSSHYGVVYNDALISADTNYYMPTDNKLPVTVILDMPVPGNQGLQYSCGAWAAIYAADYYMHISTGKAYSDSENLSPAFIYNQLSNGKCGITSLIDNLKLLTAQGACSFKAMPYNANDCATQPNCMQRDNAGLHKIKGWQKINTSDITIIKSVLFHNKPVIFSIATDEGLDRIITPFIWKERCGKTEQTHTMTISGYDDRRNAFLVMNSWGTSWGDKGFVWIDYSFFLKNVLPDGYILL